MVARVNQQEKENKMAEENEGKEFTEETPQSLEEDDEIVTGETDTEEDDTEVDTDDDEDSLDSEDSEKP